MFDAAYMLMERPHGFTVADRSFFIYPPTLGMMYMMQKLIGRLGLNEDLMQASPLLEVLRIVKNRKRECCDIIAYATCKTKDDVFNGELTNDRAEFFERHLDVEEVAQLLVVAIDTTSHRQWMDEAGIVKEQKRTAAINRAKDASGSVITGGTTIFGRLIDPAMHRYGWTYEYTVWGVSVAVLEVLLADRVNDIYLTEEERKRVPQHLLDNDVISGDDPKNFERMMAITNI